MRGLSKDTLTRVSNAGPVFAWKSSAIAHWHVRMVEAQTARSVFSWPASCTEANWAKSLAAGVLARTTDHRFPLHPSCVPSILVSLKYSCDHALCKKATPTSPATASHGNAPLLFRKGQQTHLTLHVALGLFCKRLASPVLKEREVQYVAIHLMKLVLKLVKPCALSSFWKGAQRAAPFFP